MASGEDVDSAKQSVVVDNPDTPKAPGEPYTKTGADSPDGTGYAVAVGIALAEAVGAHGVLAYCMCNAFATKKTEEAAEASG